MHKNLTPEKWTGYAKTQHVLMISNELNRALNCLRKNLPEDAEKCYERAIELTDLTVEDPRWEPALKELLRFREVLAELYLDKDKKLARRALSVLLSFDVEASNMLARV